MDEIVRAAMAKWPKVPAVFGWLQLDARGQWRIQGEPVRNAAIGAFIGRNYQADPQGRWYFQNGPQKVYVQLADAPWVYRIETDGSVRSHTGARPRRLAGAATLADGRFLLVTELGPGVLDDRDGAALLAAITTPDGQPIDEAGFERWHRGEADGRVDAARLALAGGRVAIERLAPAQLEARFGFVRAPQPDAPDG